MAHTTSAIPRTRSGPQTNPLDFSFLKKIFGMPSGQLIQLTPSITHTVILPPNNGERMHQVGPGSYELLPVLKPGEERCEFCHRRPVPHPARETCSASCASRLGTKRRKEKEAEEKVYRMTIQEFMVKNYLVHGISRSSF